MQTNNNPYQFMRYRQLSFDDDAVTQQKLRRRLNILQKWSVSFEDFYPADNYGGYWNFKIPILQSIVNGDDVPFAIRKEIIQYMIDAMAHIINAKQKNKDKLRCKIMCLVCIPDMFGSELTIFLDKGYYDRFFIRDSEEHQVMPITCGQRSIIKEYGIKLPNTIALQEQGYFETRNYTNCKYQGEWWAIGQL